MLPGRRRASILYSIYRSPGNNPYEGRPDIASLNCKPHFCIVANDKRVAADPTTLNPKPLEPEKGSGLGFWVWRILTQLTLCKLWFFKCAKFSELGSLVGPQDSTAP